MSYMQLNSKGNLTRKDIKLEWREITEFLFYKFIQIQTAISISQLVYEILQTFFQLSTPFYQIFQKKKENKKFT